MSYTKILRTTHSIAKQKCQNNKYVADSLISVLSIVNYQHWSSKAFKNICKVKYFKCNTSNIEAESLRTVEFPDQQKAPWENNFRGKAKKPPYT